MKKIILMSLIATASVAYTKSKFIFPEESLLNPAYYAGYDDGQNRRQYYNTYTGSKKNLYDIGFLDGTMDYLSDRIKFDCNLPAER